FLISVCVIAINAANNAVANPTTAITSIVTGESVNNIFARTTIYIPAVTIVAAWISADTGVGPAMASGSQVNNGICADLPVAATNNKSVITSRVELPVGIFVASANTVPYSKLPKVSRIKNIAIRKPKSPIRFITKAFFAAEAYEAFLNQNPINR